MLRNRFRGNDIKMKSMNARMTFPGSRYIVKQSIQFTTTVRELIVHCITGKFNGYIISICVFPVATETALHKFLQALELQITSTINFFFSEQILFVTRFRIDLYCLKST